MDVEALVSDGIESGDGWVVLLDQQVIPSIQTVGGRLSGVKDDWGRKLAPENPYLVHKIYPICGEKMS
jgi:hypothetical protein